jgi:drug/metabolite transporter (DMT)-like permease
MKRTIAAILIAPLIPALFYMVYEPSLFYLFYSYFLSWILGIPTILILKKLKKERHWIYGLIGFLGGMLYIVAPSIFARYSLYTDGLVAAILFGTYGFITALCFSFIQGKKNQKFKQRV